MNRPASTLAMALFVICASGAAHADEPATPVAVPHADGKTLFQDKCGVCHLQHGTGTFMLERRLGKEKALLATRVDLDAAAITSAVRRGIGSMPPLTRIEVPDGDLQTIIGYLKRPAAERNGE